MNLSQLKKNVGWRMQLMPPVCHLDRNGAPLAEKNEDWIVESVTDDAIVLRSNDDLFFKLGPDNVFSFGSNPERSGANGNYGLLSLKVQVYFKGNEVLFALNARPSERVPPPIVEQTELVALGPDIIAEGKLRQVDAAQWTIEFHRFVTGDHRALIAFIERFDAIDPYDRYVLFSGLGDGRALTAPPAYEKSGTLTIVRCAVAPAFRRIEAQRLGGDMAISLETYDVFAANGRIARVAGVDALPQKIHLVLSHIRGESPIYTSSGSRVQELFWRYKDAPFLNTILKLDVIRLASIPYHDEIQKRNYTPFHCVDLVNEVSVLRSEIVNRRVLIGLNLEVRGLGNYRQEVNVIMPPPQVLAEIAERAKDPFGMNRG